MLKFKLLVFNEFWGKECIITRVWNLLYKKLSKYVLKMIEIGKKVLKHAYKYMYIF